MRVGIRDFFHNLRTPIRLTNSLLQFKINGAGRELGRFVINTTVGVLGFWDPAKTWMEIEPCEEDLGQTLGYYGIGNGFFIIWPVLGPSTLRDTFGRAGDYFLDPVSYVDPWWARAGITGLQTVNSTSLRLGDYEEFKRISFDPYTALLDGYIQSRQSKVEE
jgi:phospholipid-binding lipoprotein MlaA